MNSEIFVLALGLMLALLLRWGFQNLPQERWQIIASVPREKMENGFWKGINLTYYGFFNAIGLVLAVSIWLILLQSLSIPLPALAAIGIPLLAFSYPAARLLSRWVEKKPHTLTVGGACFLLMIVTPWIIFLMDRSLDSAWGLQANALILMAAGSIAYAIGEGVGRLACISFGCCYGKPLDQSHPFMQKIFRHWSFVFSGKTKKISYAHGLDGEKVIPVQAVTALLYTGCALLGIYLFLEGFYTAAFLVTLLITQGWRFFSEFFRADYRGEGKISIYQYMAVILAFYSIGAAWILPLPAPRPLDLMAGLRFMGRPVMVLFLQALWSASFLYTGRSMVTGSTLQFHVNREKI